ncbi:MAG: UDP-2,3-diacylglucosamine diphosphatase [bacterium]
MKPSDTLFISDLHLADQRPGTVSLFQNFLANQALEAGALYILGDFFDVWIGDDNRTPMIDSVKEALLKLSSRLPVYFQAGNRDFLIGNQFSVDTGVTLIPEAHVIDLNNQPTLLMHGDLLCTDDVEYQKARVMLRNPTVISDFLSKSIPEREAFAVKMRQCSGEATSMKAADIMDVNQQAVDEIMREHDVHQLIHGHTHRPDTHHFELDGQPAVRYVLAEWHENLGSVLVASDSGIAAHPVE